MSDETQTKQAFLLAKAHNFRDYVLQYKPNAALLQRLQGFQEALLLPTIATIVVPLVQAGMAKNAVTDFMTNLDGVPEAQRDAVAAKLERYLRMFSEVLLAT